MAHEIRETLQRHHVELTEGTSLHDDLAELDWLAQYPGHVFDKASPHSDNRSRLIRAFAQAIRFDRICKAFRVCSKLPGFERLACHQPNLQVSGLGPDDSMAWSLIFEIEVAARLALASEGTASFEEPDILWKTANGRNCFIACKCPRSAKSITINVGGASEQISKEGQDGVVIIGLDYILLPWTLAATGAEARTASRDSIRNMADRHRDSVARRIASSSKTLGVIFCAHAHRLAASSTDSYVNMDFYGHVVEGEDPFVAEIRDAIEVGETQMKEMRL